MADWFHEMRDDLWLPPDEQGKEEAGFLKRALKLRRGHRVLDIPCGAGRIAVHLAQAGCDMTGADIRRAFVARARKRFRTAGVGGSFAVLDMREIDWCSEFQAIYNWGGSFGYFDDGENADLILRFGRALQPGGRLLVEQLNRERILRRFMREVASEKRVSHNRWNRRRQRVESSYFVNGVHDARDRSSMRLYTASQMRALFERAGLRVESLYGDLQGGPYTRLGRELIVVGRKE